MWREITIILISICKKFAVFSMVNPFTPKGFPIDKKNRLALDRVKSISAI